MTRIDFHSNASQPLEYVCRLVKKAYFSGHKLVLVSNNKTDIDALDEALWTSLPQDFLPHCRLDDVLADATPIILAQAAEALPHYDVMINLGRELPPLFSRCDRLIEVVGQETDAVASGRARWTFYKDRGYALTHHDVGRGLTP
jgi:DNA polymerase III subunit chi